MMWIQWMLLDMAAAVAHANEDVGTIDARPCMAELCHDRACCTRTTPNARTTIWQLFVHTAVQQPWSDPREHQACN
jgi:hypothetical protein